MTASTLLLLSARPSATEAAANFYETVFLSFIHVFDIPSKVSSVHLAVEDFRDLMVDRNFLRQLPSSYIPFPGLIHDLLAGIPEADSVREMPLDSTPVC
jgi:hypothetical protein